MNADPNSRWPPDVDIAPALQTDFLQAVRHQAKAAADRATRVGPLTLLLSGGLQSEFLARALRTEGLAFRARVCRIKMDGFRDNEFDIHRAISLCEDLTIPYEFSDWDLEDFLDGEVQALAERVQLSDLELLLAIRMCQDSSVYLVRAGGLPTLVQRSGEFHLGHWSHWMRELKFGRLNLKRCTLAFFSAEDDLIASYLAHPLLAKWRALAPQVGFTDTREWREVIFKTYCPEIVSRPALSGFEGFAIPLGQAGRHLRS